MTPYYKLVDGEPVPVADAREWGRWFATADRRIACNFVGQFFVSTVFLGLNHRFSGLGRPLLYETMVFDDGMRATELSAHCIRTASRTDAMRAHRHVCGFLQRPDRYGILPWRVPRSKRRRIRRKWAKRPENYDRLPPMPELM